MTTRTDYEIDYKPIYVNGNTIGEVRGDTFQKTIQTRHMLRIPPAIAFDISTLHDALDMGATKAKVTDGDTGIIYRATMDTIFNKGVRFNRGYGDQIYLPLRYWNTKDEDMPVQFELFARVM